MHILYSFNCAWISAPSLAIKHLMNPLWHYQIPMPVNNHVTFCIVTIVFVFFDQLTPLHRAAKRGYKSVVEYFVRIGAVVDDGDNDQVPM